MRQSPRVILGEPVVVSQAPLDVRDWGPWQYPYLERLQDGRLHINFHGEADSAKAYGLPAHHAVSSDQGRSWQEAHDLPSGGGVVCANGDHLRAVILRSRPVRELLLPRPVGMHKNTYGDAGNFTLYNLADLPPELRKGWRFARQRAGTKEWVEEDAAVHIRGEIRWASEGVLVFPWMWRMRLAPDGSLWGPFYAPPRRSQIGPTTHWQVQILRSTDHGRSWDTLSEISYHPDPEADPGWNVWDGFTEPNVGFLRDGSVICFLRTTGGYGIGPMYCCHSRDGGGSWSRPRVFDDRGVWRTVLELANGTMLVAYGRTGLFVRATSDPSGNEWAERVTVVEPAGYQTDTCSYADMIALDERTALIAYSHFSWPDREGRTRKSIIVRTVTVDAP